MDTAVTIPADFRPVQLLLDAGNVADALSLVTKLVQNDPSNRQLEFYSLLARVIASGAEQYEAEIERLCTQHDLSVNEHAIATQILRQGFESATRKGDAGKAWAYQRALRRFVAGLPLDRPIAPVRCVEAVQEKVPSASCSPVELANLRAIFSEEGQDEGCRDGWSVHFSDRLKGKLRSLSALCVNLKPFVVTRDTASKLVRHKFLADRNVISDPSKTIRTHHLGRNRAAGRLVPTAFVFLAGMGVSFVSMKLSELKKQNPRIATSVQPTPASLPAPVPVLQSVPMHSPSQQNTVTKSGKPNMVRGALSRTDARNFDVPVKSRASAQRKRETKRRDPTFHTPLEFKATQTIGLRGAPRFGAPKGDPQKSGTRLIMMEQKGSWLKVRNEATGSTGYVRKEFVAPVAPDP